MSEGKIKWAVVATVDEPALLLHAFAAHHLAIGAAEVHLCFDRPTDDAADALRGLPGVHVHLCNRAWWLQAGLGRRPPHNRRRQYVNATLLSTMTEAEYLLHCDADEFLITHGQLQAELGPLRGRRHWFKIENRERAYLEGAPPHSIFDGVFKRHPDTSDGVPVLQHPLLSGGFVAHAAGKAMSPVARGYSISIHAPMIGPTHLRNIPPHRRADRVEILHFDGLTPLNWAAKLLRIATHGRDRIAAMPGWRRRQLQEVYRRAENPDAVRSLYAEMNTISPTALRRHKAAGRVSDNRFDPTDALRRLCPDLTFDLSPTAYDRLIEPIYERSLRAIRDDPMIEL